MTQLANTPTSLVYGIPVPSIYNLAMRARKTPTVNGELGLLVDLVEPDGLVELDLAGDGAGVALLVHPLDGERVVPVEAADLAHLVDQLLVADPVIDVGDEHAPVEQRS